MKRRRITMDIDLVSTLAGIRTSELISIIKEVDQLVADAGFTGDLEKYFVEESNKERGHGVYHDGVVSQPKMTTLGDEF